MILIDLLSNPTEFFQTARDKHWREAFGFFLIITVALSILTPIANYLGIQSTDISSAYQAQIIAYRVSTVLLPQYGVYTYFIEALLIIGFAIIILLFLTGFVHVIYRAMGGSGPISNAWKTSCYGVAPCILGGFLPYISLFAAAYSLLLQIYIGPKTLYGVQESRAVVFLAVILALTFIEMLTVGTTVEFFA
nr:YIP1 family protein [Candidatus Njordarchaeota archaeon]